MRIDSGSIAIAFSTYPTVNIADYVSNIIENIEFFAKGRQNNYIEKDEASMSLYLVYHVFGKYDLMILNSFKNLSIANRAFFPSRLTSGEIEDVKTNIISGIPIKQKQSNSDIFKSLEIRNNSFSCVCNMKVSNTFLIGNGYDFLQIVFDKIISIVSDIEKISLILIDSFSAFEISYVLFSDDINLINETLLKIRKLQIKDLFLISTEVAATAKERKEEEEEENLLRQKLIDNCYTVLVLSGNIKDINKENYLKLSNAHVFEDSQSFFGVKLNKRFLQKSEGLEQKLEWDVLPKVLKSVSDKVNAIIELTVKPGHEICLLKSLTEFSKDNGDFLNFDSLYFVPGKTDYQFELKVTCLYSYNLLFNELVTENSNIIKHLRGIQTKLKFRDDTLMKLIESGGGLKSYTCKNEFDYGIVSGLSKVNELSIGLEKIDQLRRDIKYLKVSRELRNRILKTVYSLHSALKNPFVFPLFIDLVLYVKELFNVISENKNEVKNYYDLTNVEPLNSKSVMDLEIILSTIIKTFEGSFNLRYVNNYLFDEVNNFMIEHNSPVHQLITAFDNYFKSMSSFVMTNVEACKIITTVNELKTDANLTRVNFAIYNIYEPGILFVLATKEIFVNLLKSIDRQDLKNENNTIYRDYWMKYYKENPMNSTIPYCDQIYCSGYEYVTIDYFRFKLFFKKDFELFAYWHIAVISQTPSNYDTNGNFNLEKLFFELFRLMNVAILTKNFEMSNIKALFPHPSVKQRWEKWADDLEKPIREFVNSNIDFNIIIDSDLVEATNQSFAQVLSTDFEYLAFYENIDTTIIDSYYNEIDFDKSLDIITNLLKKDEFRYYCWALSLKYLSVVKEDGIKPTILDRDNIEGSILPVTHVEKKAYFWMDPTGGAFFPSKDKMIKYSLIRNKVLSALMHHSMIFKKTMHDIIKNH